LLGQHQYGGSDRLPARASPMLGVGLLPLPPMLLLSHPCNLSIPPVAGCRAPLPKRSTGTAPPLSGHAQTGAAQTSATAARWAGRGGGAAGESAGALFGSVVCVRSGVGLSPFPRLALIWFLCHAAAWRRRRPPAGAMAGVRGLPAGGGGTIWRALAAAPLPCTHGLLQRVPSRLLPSRCQYML
jgi:hypothetical protein